MLGEVLGCSGRRKQQEREMKLHRGGIRKAVNE
jgi:hypothetical protein